MRPVARLQRAEHPGLNQRRQGKRKSVALLYETGIEIVGKDAIIPLLEGGAATIAPTHHVQVFEVGAAFLGDLCKGGVKKAYELNAERAENDRIKGRHAENVTLPGGEQGACASE